MAHKSKKKHIKHVHEHDLSTAPPKPKRRAGAKAATAGTEGMKTKPTMKTTPTKRRGIVRSIARAATRNIAAKPRKIVKRIKSLLG